MILKTPKGNYLLGFLIENHNLREWFLGLDLASLAIPFDDFKANTMAIRAEYFNLTDEKWLMGRGGFLKKITEYVRNGGKIFRHPIMHELFEKKALENISQN